MPNVQEKVSNVTEQMRNVTEQAMEAAQSVTSKVTDFFQGNPFGKFFFHSLNFSLILWYRSMI